MNQTELEEIRTVRADPGVHIEQAIRNAIAFAKAHNCIARLEFNGTPIDVGMYSSVEGSVADFYARRA